MLPATIRTQSPPRSPLPALPTVADTLPLYLRTVLCAPLLTWCRAVQAASDPEPLIAAASPVDRADLMHVLGVDDPLEREMRIRTIQRAWLDAHPQHVAALKDFYYANVADFISQFMVTSDPRRASTGSTLIPFILYPKQRELVEFIMERYLAGEPAAIPKARGVGATYVAGAVLVSIAVLGNKGFQATVGSATEPKIDGNRSNKNTIFYKLREVADNLPPQFQAGYKASDSNLHVHVVPRTVGGNQRRGGQANWALRA